MARRSTRRRMRAGIAVMSAVLLLSATPAAADPADGESDLGGELGAAIEEYLEAEEVLNNAKSRQKEIKKEISAGKKAVKELTAEVSEFAAAAYRSGGVSEIAAVVTTGSPKTAVESISMVSYLGDQTGSKIQELLDAKEELEAEKDALADAKEEAEQAVADSREARDQAARAIAANGGNSLPGPSPSDARPADPAPRNPDGSLPAEGCQVDDPTPANGCLTPRMLHALQQAEIAGFQRYVSCYRGGGYGEHPQGRACDFSAEPGGFGGVAGGEAKQYGDNLAAWFVQNADALGVMYVIWYNQFWSPSQGWIAYTGGGGDPSSDHTNHVHLSIR